MKNMETSAIKKGAIKVAKKLVQEVGNNWPADNCFFWSYEPKRPSALLKADKEKALSIENK